NGLVKAATSMTSNSGLIKKIYFPRLILPLIAIASGLVDFALSFLMLLVLMAYFALTAINTTGTLAIYGIQPGSFAYEAFQSVGVHFEIMPNIIWLPALILLAFIASL